MNFAPCGSKEWKHRIRRKQHKGDGSVVTSAIRVTLRKIGRLPLVFWRRVRTLEWERNLRIGAHLAQILLVFGAIAGYFLTVRPINQKEKLEEDMVEAREAVEAARKEAASLQVRIQDFNRKIQTLDEERTALSAEVQQAKEQATQDAAELRERHEAERRTLIVEQENFRKRMAAEKAATEAEFAEQLKSIAEEKDRMQVFNELRSGVFAACLSPSDDMFLDLQLKLPRCMTSVATSMNLAPADNELVGAWAEREARVMAERTEQEDRRYSALGRRVVSETFHASVPCERARDNSGQIIELEHPTSVPGRRCIGIDTISDKIGSYVARYAALQSAVEAAVAGAAARRDPTKFVLPPPNPPTMISVH